METNIIEKLNSRIGGKIAKDGKEYINASVSDIDKAMTYILPALLGHLIARVNSVEDAEEYKEYLDKEGFDGSLMKDLENVFDGSELTHKLLSKGEDELRYFLGDKLDDFLSAISEFVNIPSKSVKILAKLTSVSLQSYMAETIGKEELSAKKLKKLLDNQEDIVTRQTPSKLYDILGLDFSTNKKSGEQESEKDSSKSEEGEQSQDTEEKKKEEETFSLGKFSLQFLPQLGLLILIGGLLFFISDLNKENSSLLNDSSEEETEKAFNERPLLSWGLPNGKEVNAPEGSVIDKLIEYLNKGNHDNEKSLLINETIVVPENDSINAIGVEIVEGLARVMNAYPDLSIRWDVFMPEDSNPSKSPVGSELKKLLIENGVEGDRITWKLGLKNSIGGGNNYQINCVAIISDKESSSQGNSENSKNSENSINKVY